MNETCLHKELDLIQNCINRMAQNSFMLKGWAVSMLAVVIALTKDSLQPTVLTLAALVPLVSFWCLDAFFLRKEREYRKMYEWVLEVRKKDNLEFQYDLNASRFEKDVESYICVMFSKTLSLFYGILAIIILGLIVFLFF